MKLLSHFRCLGAFLLLLLCSTVLRGQTDSLQAALLRADQARVGGEIQSAESQYLALIPQAKADTAWEVLANAYFGLGGIYAEEGRTEWNYQTYIRPGVQIVQEKLPESASLALRFAILEAQYLWNTGRYRNALDALKLVEPQLPLFLESQAAAGADGRQYSLVFSFRNLEALCWQSLQDFQSFEQASEQQLAAIEQFRLPDPGQTALYRGIFSGIYHLNQGVTYDAQDRWEEALTAYETAASLLAQTKHAYFPAALFNQAGIWYRKKNFSRSRELALESIGNTAPNSPELTKVYDLLAKIASETGEADSLYRYSRNILALRSSAPEKMLQTQEIPGLRELEAESYVFNALRMLSGYHLGQSRMGRDPEANLGAALGYAQLTRSWVDSLRREGYWGNANDYFSSGDTLTAHMEAGIEAAMRLSNISPVDFAGPESALQLSETNKYNRLVYDIRREASGRIDGIPEDSLNKEAFFFSQIAFFTSQLRAKAGDAQSDIEDSLAFYQAGLQSLKTYFKEKHPRYHQLRYEPAQPTISAVQARLQPRQAMLEFYFGQEKIYRFLITRDTLLAEEIPLTQELASAISTFYQECLRYVPANSPELASAGHLLYQQLLESPAAFLKSQQPGTWRLGLITDGPLRYLSWAAMLTAPASRPDDPSTWSFLVKDPDLVISYQHSLSLMMAKRFNAPRKYQLGYAGFAGWYPEGDLPEARVSVQELANLPGWRQSARAWVGGPEKALSSDIFWANAASSQVLHLSLHGRASYRDPMASCLYFSDKDSLSASELFSRDVAAELVILDACEMGIGQMLPGEGVMSMATGFAYSGAPSTLMSLWQLDEKSSRFLIKRFIDALHAGQAKDGAWQQAQLAYLEESSGNKHPFFWAGMIMVGDMEPLSQRSFTWVYWLIGLVAIGLGGLWWWKKRQAA